MTGIIVAGDLGEIQRDMMGKNTICTTASWRRMKGVGYIPESSMTAKVDNDSVTTPRIRQGAGLLEEDRLRKVTVP